MKDLREMLLKLDHNALVDVLRDVFAKKIPDPEETSVSKNRFFLGIASGRTDTGRWDIEAVGYPDREKYPGPIGAECGLWQNGECMACKIKIRSSMKNAICPLCGSKVYLT